MISCCGRGGSWFRNCGSDGNAKLHYTWSEGIHACKLPQPQSKTGIVQEQNTDSFNSATVHSKVIYAAVSTSIRMSTITLANSPSTTSARPPAFTTSTSTLIASATYTSVSTSATTQGCETLLNTTVYIILCLIILFI